MRKLLPVMAVLTAMLLTACTFSLAEDITPPPGYRSPTPPPTLGPLYPPSAPDLANGAAIYAEKCLPCHGESGLGDGPQGKQLPVRVAAIGLPEVARRASPMDWFTVVTRGNVDRFMPPFTSLSAQERWDVIAYAMTLSVTPEQIAQGKALYEANCLECHGADGAQVETARFDDQERMAQRSAEALFYAITQGGEEMPPFAAELDEDERWALTAYLRTFTFPEASPASPTATAPPAPSETPSTEALSTETPPETPLAAETSQVGETPTEAQSAITITGEVTNGSGGPLPEGMTVTLQGFVQDATGNFQRVVEEETEVAGDGSFTFEGVDASTPRVFIVVAEFDGVQYFSEPAMVTGTEGEVQLPVMVYDTTTDTSALTIDRWHILLDFPNPDSVQVIEVFVISNLSQETVVPPAEGQPVLTFVLPEGASNLQFENGVLGERFVTVEGGFGDTTPIVPGAGNYQVVFAFDLPYKRKLEFSQPVSLVVDSTVVLVPEGVRITSDLLTESGTREVQGTSYMMYASSTLPAGSRLDMRISGRPKTGPSATTSISSQEGILIGAGALGVALVLAGVWMYLRDRGRSDEDAGEEDADMEDADSVMDAIIALDDLHRAGELPDDAYYRRRAELKEQLRRLLEEEGE